MVSAFRLAHAIESESVNWLVQHVKIGHQCRATRALAGLGTGWFREQRELHCGKRCSRLERMRGEDDLNLQAFFGGSLTKDLVLKAFLN